MTYEKMKKKVVEEEGWVTIKEMHRVVRRLGLLIICFGSSLGLVASKVLNTGSVFLILILLGLCFVSALDYGISSQSVFIKLSKLVRIWWLGIPILAVVYVVLAYFGFL